MMMKKKTNRMHIGQICIYDKQLFHILRSTTIEPCYFKPNNIGLQRQKTTFLNGSNNNGESLLFRKAQDSKNSYLENLRLKYPAVSTFPLIDIINNPFVLENILNLSTKFDCCRADMKKKKDCKSKQVKGGNHFLQCVLIHCSILIKLRHSGVKIDFILALFAYINHLGSYSMP